LHLIQRHLQDHAGSATIKMPPLSLSEIPTLSLLYRLGKLSPPSTAISSTPSAQYNSIVSLIRTDITTLRVGAIVNAANNSLLGGGGVDGAIHRAAGPDLLRECEKFDDGCDTGDAKITGAYELPCNKVIHAVGPIYRIDKNPEGKLRSCYRTSLDLAKKNDCKSIAFSALSTGVYGYPSGKAAEAALDEVKKWLEEHKNDGEKGTVGGIERIIFCCFEMKDVKAYEEWLPKIFPPANEDVSNNEESEKNAAVAEDLKKSMPDPPKTDPLQPGEPSTKRQKVTDSTNDMLDGAKHEAKTDDDDWEKVEQPVDSDQVSGKAIDETAASTVSIMNSTESKQEHMSTDQKTASQHGIVEKKDIDMKNMLEKDW